MHLRQADIACRDIGGESYEFGKKHSVFEKAEKDNAGAAGGDDVGFKTDHIQMGSGWDFPHVSLEMQNRFGLRGYGAAYVLPEGFETDCPGVEYADQRDADYAVITVYDPFAAAFERIPNAYKRILEFLQVNGFREKPREDILACFEHVYEKNGMTCMDVYIHVDSVSKTDSFTNFS